MKPFIEAVAAECLSAERRDSEVAISAAGYARVSPPDAIEMRAAVAMLNDSVGPPPSGVVMQLRPQLRVIQGGRA